ncbi:MAG: 6,7-dimethyl-8-ribityllumazine synthase [Phycisphaeraceae bacterium]|nr:6,7-dimethyl-8-ribityllumazine synthase [Phycisphaerae bacterium]MBX3391761.1 6,7-dimethyl-8-ribityllumazine synthase [Phycisphaeraceae bacterium]
MPKPTGAGRSSREPSPAVALVVSRYNPSVTDRLRDGALLEYATRFPGASGVVIVDAPGSFELPALSLAAARGGRFEGVVALGCLIKGETSHDRYIAQAVSQGLLGVTLSTGIPVAFGVLTVDTPRQARDRAGGRLGNKGQEAMAAVLDSIDQIRILEGRSAFRAAVVTEGITGVVDKAAGRRGRRA